jgi:hypothetical protein
MNDIPDRHPIDPDEQHMIYARRYAPQVMEPLDDEHIRELKKAIAEMVKLWSK